MLTLFRTIAPGLVRSGARPITSTPRLLASGNDKHDEFDDDVFELLPPGSSMKDPLYGHNENVRVHVHDRARSLDDSSETIEPLKPREAPTLEADKPAKAKAPEPQEEDDDTYVYLPPGSSMREPGDSMSDPADGARRVYYRDPSHRE